jgi:copper(I)-binding protein
MKMTAGFGQLTNNGPAAMEIIAFSSPSFDDVSLHRTEQVDGVSKMRAVGALSVAAGETVELAPGGYHLMFMMPTGETEQGGRVKLSMRTTDGREFTFDLPVERR